MKYMWVINKTCKKEIKIRFKPYISLYKPSASEKYQPLNVICSNHYKRQSHSTSRRSINYISGVSKQTKFLKSEYNSLIAKQRLYQAAQHIAITRRYITVTKAKLLAKEYLLSIKHRPMVAINISLHFSLATCLSLISGLWNFISWNIKICLCSPIFSPISQKRSICIIHQKRRQWLHVSSLCWDVWKEGSGGYFGHEFVSGQLKHISEVIAI